MCFRLALCWPELILEAWQLHGGHSSTHWGRVPRTITTFWRSWEIKHQTNTHLHYQVVVQRGNWTQIWCLSTGKKLKGAKLKNWLLTPTVVNEEYTPRFWRFVNSVYTFRLLVGRAIHKCILCWGSVGKVRLQKQWKWHRQYSPPVAGPALIFSGMLILFLTFLLLLTIFQYSSAYFYLKFPISQWKSFLDWLNSLFTVFLYVLPRSFIWFYLLHDAYV